MERLYLIIGIAISVMADYQRVTFHAITVMGVVWGKHANNSGGQYRDLHRRNELGRGWSTNNAVKVQGTVWGRSPKGLLDGEGPGKVW